MTSQVSSHNGETSGDSEGKRTGRRFAFRSHIIIIGVIIGAVTATADGSLAAIRREPVDQQSGTVASSAASSAAMYPSRGHRERGGGVATSLQSKLISLAAEPGPDETAPKSVAPGSLPPSLDFDDSGTIPSARWTTADAEPVWKTIRIGGFRNANALREALDSDDCGTPDRNPALYAGPPAAIQTPKRQFPRCRLGESAAEIIGRPAFRLSRTGQQLDLVVVSVADLGFGGEKAVAIEDIYDRAELLGFQLCPAEVGPQLRLQYLDQPVGEFLNVAMDPISTYAGEPTGFSVGNGGAGLLLVGSDDRASFTVSTHSRFVFVRPRR